MKKSEQLRAELAGLRAKVKDDTAEIDRVRDELTGALMAGNAKQSDKLEAQLADMVKAATRGELRETGLQRAILEAEREELAGERAEVAADLAARIADAVAHSQELADQINALADAVEAAGDVTIGGGFWALLNAGATPSDLPAVPSFARLFVAAERIKTAAAKHRMFVDGLTSCRFGVLDIATQRENTGSSSYDRQLESEAAIKAAKLLPPEPRKPGIPGGFVGDGGVFLTSNARAA